VADDLAQAAADLGGADVIARGSRIRNARVGLARDGDMAAAVSGDTGEPVPGVAQGAIQMGRFAGKTIADEVAGRSSMANRGKFVYRDKGSLAVIGKAKAVAHIRNRKFGGFFAWLIWGGIHIAFLIGFRNRLQVLFSWFWNWLLNTRDARLITGEAHLDLRISRTGDQSTSDARIQIQSVKAEAER